MKDVMRDKSFLNLEELLRQKKERLQMEIIQKQQKIVEIEEFLRTGQEETDE